MPQLPRKMSPGNPLTDQWNSMVDYLTSLRPVQSPGTITTHTIHGVIRKTTPGNASGSAASDEIEVDLCDPTTGEVTTYLLRGRVKPTA